MGDLNIPFVRKIWNDYTNSPVYSDENDVITSWDDTLSARTDKFMQEQAEIYENAKRINTLPSAVLPSNEHNMMQNDVRIFMEAGEQYVQDTAGFNEKNASASALYMKLIDEEYRELVQGFDEKDIIATADGIGDLIWVIMGLANSLGINVAAVWQEVLASNMSKTVNGKLIKREDGKILKPETYFPPNIAKALSLGEES